jgi:hypothetical protein
MFIFLSQIMTYHDALINQLSGLVQKVEKLRTCLQETDKTVFKVRSSCIYILSHSLILFITTQHQV